MSERNWTPEPWVTSASVMDDPNDGPVFVATLERSQANIICRIENRVADRPLDEEDAANAIRIVSCVNACTGAPAPIQPGAVVALAEALEEMLLELDQHQSDPVNQQWMGSPMRNKARAALALYNGKGVVDGNE